MKRPLATLLLVAAGCGGHASNAAQPTPPAGEAWLTPQQVKNANLDVKPVTGEISCETSRSSNVTLPLVTTAPPTS